MSDPAKPAQTLLEKNGYRKCYRCKLSRHVSKLFETIMHGKVAFRCNEAEKEACAAEVRRNNEAGS